MIISKKLVVLGDSAVGKTSIATQFVRGEFLEFQEPTIGAAFMTAKAEHENHVVKFEIWDTAGQERYRSLAPMYYRGASIAFIVYDITNKDSFDNCKSWISELQLKGGKDLSIIIVGNKSDHAENRSVTYEDGYQLAQQYELNFIEVSAKNNSNIGQLFSTAAKLVSANANDEDENNVSIKIVPEKKSSNFHFVTNLKTNWCI